MADILYVGRLPLAEAAAALLRERGHAGVMLSARDALLRVRRSGCGAVVIRWTCGRAGPAMAAAAKRRATPVIVVSSRLVRAFRRFGSLAEIFLEEPASAEEIAILAIHLILQAERAASSEAAAAAA